MGNVGSAEGETPTGALIYLNEKLLRCLSHAQQEGLLRRHTELLIQQISRYRQLHQDKGIKVPGFLISPSYFIIIDLKLVKGYLAAAGSWEGKFALVK